MKLTQESLRLALIIMGFFILGTVTGLLQAQDTVVDLPAYTTSFDLIDEKQNYFSASDVYFPYNDVCLTPQGEDKIYMARTKLTGSMFPNIHGDLVLEVAVPLIEDLNVGMMIVFERQSDSKRILHRIVEIGNDGEWYAITKGDNTTYSDGKVRYEKILARVVWVLY